MNSREKDRLNYQIYHESGKKVPKLVEEEHSTEMEGEDVLSEKQLREDIDHALEIYAIEDCVTVDEINEGVTEILRLGKEFRHIHVRLKIVLQRDYETHYPDYKANLLKIIGYVKESRTKLREIKEEEKGKNVREDENPLKKNEEKLYMDQLLL